MVFGYRHSLVDDRGRMIFLNLKKMEWSFKLYASVKNKIIVMPFVFFYHDTLILSILPVYTTHTTCESFSSIQLILTVGCFYTGPFRTLV
jgi:hypothetical protein